MKMTAKSKLDYSIIRNVIRSSPYQKALHHPSVTNDSNISVSKLTDIYKRLSGFIPQDHEPAIPIKNEHNTTNLPQTTPSTLDIPASVPIKPSLDGSQSPDTYPSVEILGEGTEKTSDQHQTRDDQNSRAHTYSATFDINEHEDTSQIGMTSTHLARNAAAKKSNGKPKARPSFRGHPQSPAWVKKNKG